MPPPAPVNSSCRRTSIAFGALLDDPELIEDRIECFYARFFRRALPTLPRSSLPLPKSIAPNKQSARGAEAEWYLELVSQLLEPVFLDA
jgi:hypothetical protein